MTKSRQSATKLRLSRLIKLLLAIGCVKLGLMGLAAFHLPLPPWAESSGSSAPSASSAPAAQQSGEDVSAKLKALADSMGVREERKNSEPMPEGTAAAELAAAARPRNPAAAISPLPAPLLPAGPASVAGLSGAFTAPALPEPAPLGAPLVPAGIPAPQQPGQAADNETGIWDMLSLKSLPIPGLGSAGAAHAAALDMPAPPVSPGPSPFTPAEQLAPLGNGADMPGAPPIPAGIPSGTSATGPLPQRSYAGPSAPAPNIAPLPSAMDPAIQSREMARQEQDILMLRQQMDQRLKDLKAAEDKMKEMISQANALEDKKIKSLVQMYGNMKPRTAAQAMESMDERVAVRILSGMPPKQSGEILTYTNPAKTAKFTEMLTRMRMGQ